METAAPRLFTAIKTTLNAGIVAGDQTIPDGVPLRRNHPGARICDQSDATFERQVAE